MQVIDEIAREIYKKQNNSIGKALFSTGLVLGTMTAVGPTYEERKVKLDNFKHEVNCLVLHYLTIPDDYIEKTEVGQGNHPHGPSGTHSQYSGSGTHSHPDSEGKHIHDVITPIQLKPLKEGERVLVAIVNNGSDHVVIGRVV